MSSHGPLAEPYPRWSSAELERRRVALLAAMNDAGVTRALLYGANRFGSAVPWLTGWPVTREALVLVERDERDVLLVQFYNHVPNAQAIARDSDVRWGGSSTVASAVDIIARRGGAGDPVGVIGPLPFSAARVVEERAGRIIDLNLAYTRLRLVKSQEELEWLRIGAALTDRAFEALLNGARPGIDERALGDIVERAYVAQGGVNHIHYFGVTQMTEPDVSVPAQWPSARRLRSGDVLVAEISASFWEYAGQVLRTMTISADPTPLYRDLHDVAVAAFDAITSRLHPGASARELMDAASIIEDAGFTIRDDLVHGFVGGYLPPVLGTHGRAHSAVPEFVFEEGMTVVVQPNVIARDEKAGVQTGELLLVTASGSTSMHSVQRGLLRVG